MRPPRISFAGATYHTSTRCNNQEFLFEGTEDFELFMETLEKAKIKYNVKVNDYNFMNNHVHLVIETVEDNLSKFMGYVNGQFAKNYNKKHGRTGHFWGERFHSTVIESDTQLFRTLLYVEFNMVRCGVVQNPSDWKWSGYNTHAYGQLNPVLDLHQLYLALGQTPEARQEAYRKMAEGYMEEKGYKQKQLISKGLIVGSENFVKNIVEKLAQKSKFYRNRKIFAFETGCFSLRKIASETK